MVLSRFVLPRVFRGVAKVSELILVTSLGWCFLMCGIAGRIGLSYEMGALIAGVAISTFPYNTDVMAKVVSIRDFFVTLFFVALGLQIPNPLNNMSVLGLAAVASLFLVASRFLVLVPVLRTLKYDNRIGLVTSINLSQMSEFSLVVASLGLAAGHISRDTMSTLIFVFVFTAVASNYLITYSHAVQRLLGRWMVRIGLSDALQREAAETPVAAREIALLGYHHVASSLLKEIEVLERSGQATGLREKIMVVDFNPEMHHRLQRDGVRVVYGDISHPATLQHAGVQDVKLAMSTIPDALLFGTNNRKLVRTMKYVCPNARIVVTATGPESALDLYAEGADYVILPRVVTAAHVLPLIATLLGDDAIARDALKQAAIDAIKQRADPAAGWQKPGGR
jgi:voltage-gated potassium channel Kch